MIDLCPKNWFLLAFFFSPIAHTFRQMQITNRGKSTYTFTSRKGPKSRILKRKEGSSKEGNHTTKDETTRKQQSAIATNKQYN